MRVKASLYGEEVKFQVNTWDVLHKYGFYGGDAPFASKITDAVEEKLRELLPLVDFYRVETSLLDYICCPEMREYEINKKKKKSKTLKLIESTLEYIDSLELDLIADNEWRD